MTADLLNAALDVRSLSGTFDDNGIFLVNRYALGPTEIGKLNVFKLDSKIFGDALPTGKDSDVTEHFLAAISKAGSFDRASVQGAAKLVHNECRESLALDVFRNDKKSFALLGNQLQNRKQIIQRGDLLFVDKDVAILKHGFHGVVVGAEVRTQVTFVELHAFHNAESGLDALGLFDGNGSVLAYLVHRVRNDLADFSIPVGGDGSDLSDFFAIGNFLAVTKQLADASLNCLVDATLQVYRIRPCGNVLESFAINRSSQNGGSSGAVTGKSEVLEATSRTIWAPMFS